MYLILTLLSIACNNMLISEDYKMHKHTHNVHEIKKKKKKRGRGVHNKTDTVCKRRVDHHSDRSAKPYGKNMSQ